MLERVDRPGFVVYYLDTTGEGEATMALSIDSTIGAILADEGGKAVLEKHMPGISTNPQIDQAKGMSLKAIAPMSQGAITEDMLKAIAEDLSKL